MTEIKEAVSINATHFNSENKTTHAIYQVCIPKTFHQYFDYLGDNLQPCIGARVWVPFGKKQRLGIVVGKSPLSQVPKDRLKSIESVIDGEPLLCPSILHLCQWVSQYYQSPLSEVIRLAIPKAYRLGKPSSISRNKRYSFASSSETKQTSIEQEENKKASRILNEEQSIVLKVMSQNWNSYRPFLLYGVTGSGKTEVYFELIKQVLMQKRQALILVPEIGLTPQLVDRFASCFNCPMVVIHSDLSDGERQWAWEQAKQNLAPVVIGTRTAIFTPMPSLSLIIIDEEHDGSFKQNEGVRYSARDTALIRAQALQIPIVLGSATPSSESLSNCIQRKYSLLKLNFKALNQNQLHYRIMDLRNTKLKHGLTSQTLSIIEQHLAKESQVLVFINRRGFSPTLLCHACGWVARCSACDKPFTFHRMADRLLCHHCNLTKKVISSCPECQSDQLIPLGSGTQRIHEYLTRCFPEKKILRIDRDQVQKKHALSNALENIQSGDAHLIVGTQMLAKGHHFPRLNLVVILDTDTGFYSQDFRSLERLGQLIIQVAGRAGRAEHPGEVIIQTHLPDHPLLNLLIQKGYDPFIKALLNLRAQAKLPPYHFLALIRAQHKKEEKVRAFLENVKKQLGSEDISVLGPAFAPMPRKANQYRLHLLLKSPSRKKLQHALTQLREWLFVNKLSNQVRWSIDIDPIDLS